MEWRRKLKVWQRRDALNAELEEEIQTHLQVKAADLGNADAARQRACSRR